MLSEDLNTVLGVELHALSDAGYRCHYCIIVRKKDELQIESKKTVEGPLVSILERLPKNLAVALCLTGKGIIHKNGQFNQQAEAEQILQQAFPSVDTKDFYVQQYEQEGNGLISIIRKQPVDELVEKLQRAGLNIYALSLGAMPTVAVWPQLNIYGTEILFDGHEFSLSASKAFVAYKANPEVKSNFPIKIEQEVIPEAYLVAYASAFQLLLHQKLDMVLANADRINDAFVNFKQNAQLKKRALLFLFGLFGLLLLSFGLFSYYNQENAKLAQLVGNQVANADQTDLLKKNIASNEYLLKQLNWNGGYNYGFLLNEVGQSMPKQLTLHEVAINDFKTDLEKAERIPNIKILGSTDNLAAVNNWIFVLKEKTWIKSAKLLKYQEDQDGTDYLFSLIITY